MTDFTRHNSKSQFELKGTIAYSSYTVTVTTAATLTTKADYNGICYDSTNNKLYLIIATGLIYSMSLSNNVVTLLSFSGK